MATHAACSSDAPVREFATADEARDAAIELAREFTGRSTVIAVPAPYTRASLSQLVWAMAESYERIAALVVEIEPSDDAIYGRMMHKARELASAEGAMLIWCEKVPDRANFRGGLQAVYRIKADLTCLTFAGGESTWLCGKPEVIGQMTDAVVPR
jgi:glutamate-1-semialdehyde aminotransferase